MINVDKIIVLHYKPLVNRKTLFSAFLKQHDLECSWIDREPKKPWGRRKGAGLYIHDFEKDEGI